MKTIEPKKPSKSLFIFITVLAIVLWYTNFLAATNWVVFPILLGERGTFGDTFGAVNSLFSGLAFIGLFYAIQMQRYEVSIARQELKITQDIFDEQQRNLSSQNHLIKTQTFENTFFNLLSMFSEITNKIDLSRIENGIQVNTYGKDTFSVFLRRLTNQDSLKGARIFGGVEYDVFDGAYGDFYKINKNNLGHYFRLLHNLLRFVDKSEIDNKNFYTNILRAQLSDNEVSLIYYNSLSSASLGTTKPLIERYHMLKYLNENDVIAGKLKERYDLSAFIDEQI